MPERTVEINRSSKIRGCCVWILDSVKNREISSLCREHRFQDNYTPIVPIFFPAPSSEFNICSHLPCDGRIFCTSHSIFLDWICSRSIIDLDPGIASPPCEEWLCAALPARNISDTAKSHQRPWIRQSEDQREPKDFLREEQQWIIQ